MKSGSGMFLAKGVAIAACYACGTLLADWIARQAGVDQEFAAMVGGVCGLAGSTALLWWFKWGRRKHAV
jgi:drug/metabolite transporter (DMT)-like permease